MKVNNIVLDSSKIRDLWTYTGGFPAIALMIPQVGDLTTILERVWKILTDKYDEVSWKEDNIEKRWAFALNSAKVIYDKIIDNGSAYITLCCQPAGVAIDEIAVFCGCHRNEGRIFTHGDENLKDVVNVVFSGNRSKVCCSDQSSDNFLLDTQKRFKDRNRCDHHFYRSEQVVDEDLEAFYNISVNYPHLVTLELSPSGAKSVTKKYEKRKVFKLNRRFAHIPLFVRILANEGLIDRDEVAQTRRTLVKTMYVWHTKSNIITPRMAHSIYWHLDSLKSLGDIIQIANSFLDKLRVREYTEKDLEMIKRKIEEERANGFTNA